MGEIATRFWRIGSRIVRPFVVCKTKIVNRLRLRAHRAKVERQREKMQAYFAGLEAERRDREREQKARAKYQAAGLTKQQRVFRERWIRTPTGRKI